MNILQLKRNKINRISVEAKTANCGGGKIILRKDYKEALLGALDLIFIIV